MEARDGGMLIQWIEKKLVLQILGNADSMGREEVGPSDFRTLRNPTSARNVS